MESSVHIAVDYPGQDLLSYKKILGQTLAPGDLVTVPLGKREAHGCVIKIDETNSSPEIELKEVKDLYDKSLRIGQKELELYQWVARYYHYPLGQLIFDTLPKSLKRPRSIEFLTGVEGAQTFVLTEEQQSVVDNIKIKFNSFHKNYIHGVTGSGKGLIFLELVKAKLTEQKSVLFLVPEINLTPALVELFKKNIKAKILCYHSSISASEKYLIWKQLKESEEPVLVLGVRSSVFLPLPKLGLIIVDEEHDASFKQSDRCPYNGRDVAIKKAQLWNIPVVMGSATPSVENYYAFFQKENAENSSSFQIKKRALGHFPEIKIVDARENTRNNNEHWPLAIEAINKIQEVLDKGERALIFVNRLGFANFLQCSSCGYKFCDPGSDIPLRYFKNKNILASTQSDYKIPVPEWCPHCGNLELWQHGFGTEKIQETLRNIFKDKIIERFDREEINNFVKMEERLRAFSEGQIDILVGTQMLAKGHNFPKVSLVVILGIDSQLNYPDFRSCEKVYQLLTQVSGRAGRFNDSSPSTVLIQTLSPELQLFQDVQGEKFDHFYKKELEIRKMLGLPPFSRQSAIFLTSGNKEKLIDSAAILASQINEWCQYNNLNIKISGPVPLMLEKRQNKYTWCILLQSDNVHNLHLACDLAVHRRPKGIIFKLDVDPGQIL